MGPKAEARIRTASDPDRRPAGSPRQSLGGFLLSALSVLLSVSVLQDAVRWIPACGRSHDPSRCGLVFCWHRRAHRPA